MFKVLIKWHFSNLNSDGEILLGMFEILDRDHISFRLTSPPNVTVALLPSLTTGTTTENTGYFVWIYSLHCYNACQYLYAKFSCLNLTFFSALILHLLTTFLRDYGNHNLNNNHNHHNNNTISWGGLAGTTAKSFHQWWKKILLVFGSDHCQADPIFKVAPFQINRTRFSPPTITQKGDEELSTKNI